MTDRESAEFDTRLAQAEAPPAAGGGDLHAAPPPPAAPPPSWRPDLSPPLRERMQRPVQAPVPAPFGYPAGAAPRPAFIPPVPRRIGPSQLPRPSAPPADERGATGWPDPDAQTLSGRERPDWGAGQTAASPAQPPANWNYVDGLRSSELVPMRKVPPGRGWRRALFTASFGLINLGLSPDERRQVELEAKIRTLLRGHYKIGVLGKGGTGKTTIAAGVGSLIAELRCDDRVVAIDADTGFGKLGSRVDPRVSGSYWELAADQHLHSFADVRARVGSNASGLFVLAGEATTARRRVLDPGIYREATQRLDNHFTISVIDCGSTMDSPVTHEVLRDLDALIVVSSPWVDGASAAGQIMEWLANNGYTGLLHRTVVVLNDSDGHADKRTRSVLVERFSSRGQLVVEVPYDAHLRPGGVIDVDNELNRLTRRRLTEIAAAIAEHFVTTTDRPRVRR